MDAIRATGLGVTAILAIVSGALWLDSPTPPTVEVALVERCDSDCFPSLQRQLGKLDVMVAEIDRRIETALRELSDCQTRTDIAHVSRAKLEQLRKEQAEIQKRIAVARRHRMTHASPHRCIKISAACLDNPLGKGCM